MNGPVAQQGLERWPAEPEVPGSSPGGPAIALFLILLAFSQVVVLVSSQQPHFDAVVVRGDIYTDWAIAMAYGITHGSWVIHLVANNEEEVLSLLSGFIRFKKSVSILIIGAPNAVPIEFENRVRSLGASVSRVGGATRLDTSLLLAVNYWSNCKSLILVDGLNSSYYMVALSAAVERGAPIVYTKDGKPPEGFINSLKEHLKVVKSIIIIGSSLNSDTIKKLLSEGYKVKVLEEVGAPAPRYGGWSLSYIFRELSDPIPLATGLIIGVLIAYISFIYLLHEKKEKIDLMDFFTVDEKKLIDIIMEREEIPQEDLPNLTGFSKPKISRLIKELVDRRVIKRKKSGKTYLIRLTDKFRSQTS